MPFVFRVYFCGHELSDPRYGKHTFQRVRSCYESTKRERSRSALRVIRLNRINDFRTIHRKSVKNNCQTRSRPTRTFICRLLLKKTIKISNILLDIFTPNPIFVRIRHFILAFEPVMMTARAFIVCGPGRFPSRKL